MRRRFYELDELTDDVVFNLKATKQQEEKKIIIDWLLNIWYAVFDEAKW